MITNIVKCDYCGEYIEYDESDCEMACGSPLNQIYITCPVCGKPITVGTQILYR